MTCRVCGGPLPGREEKFVLMIDYMLASWQHREALDPFRVVMFGFSAGGFTALGAVGGTPDMSTVRAPLRCSSG